MIELKRPYYNAYILKRELRVNPVNATMPEEVLGTLVKLSTNQVVRFAQSLHYTPFPCPDCFRPVTSV